MTNQQRLILTVSILASFVAFLDGSVVNVALPSIARALGGGLIGQQWIVDAYMLTLGALILTAGSLSDLFGHKKILVFGLAGFGITSLLCGIAPNITTLIIFRSLQGIAGALLVPSSLAIITANFSGSSEAKAIGVWTGWTGLASIVGPVLGGSIVEFINWRVIFLVNVLPIVVTLLILMRVPSDSLHAKNVHIDFLGTGLCAIGLGLTVFGLISDGRHPFNNQLVYLPLLIGVLILFSFIYYEKQSAHPMLPLKIFKNRNFTAGNLATFAIYGGLSVNIFTVIIFLQQVAHYTAVEAGLSMLPVTFIMFFMSPRFGKLAGRYGARGFMTIGPLIASVAFLGLLRVQTQAPYDTQVLPVIIVFGFGLAMTVSPLTSAVLGSVAKTQSGIASAINNAVSRIAGLIAIAAMSLITGTSLTVHGLHLSAVAMSILLALGGIISFFGIRNQLGEKANHKSLKQTNQVL